MASHETREVRCYLRDGSLWVGHFAAEGELDFGDDRFDTAHGLASVVSTRRMILAHAVDRQTQASLRSPDIAPEDRTLRAA